MLNKSAIKTYEVYAKGIFDKSLVPGIAVGLSKDSQVQYEKGFGFRDVDNQLDITMDTIFGIASLTKSFTCISIMQLQEKGKLFVHNPVTEYLPEFRLKNTEAYKQMTIHHFMTHTSGLPPMPYMGNSLVGAVNKELKEGEEILKLMSDAEVPHSFVELMEDIAKQDVELLDPPGTVYSYSNECFCLLGEIIERASGMSYEDYVRENILKPGLLHNTGYGDEDFEGNDMLTTLYLQHKVNDGKEGELGLVASTNWWDAPAMRPTALLRSTVNDLLRYSDVFTTGGLIGSERILSEVSVQQMLTPYVATNSKPDQYYGYGLRVSKQADGSTLVGHGGNGKAVSSLIQIIPEHKIAVVALANMQLAPISSFGNGLKNVALGLEPDHNELGDKVCRLTEEELAQYAGIYNSGDRGPATVKIKGNDLTLFSYGSQVTLVGLDKDRFRIKSDGDNATVSFFRNAAGEIYRLTYGGRIHEKELD